MWIICWIILSASAWALEPFEHLSKVRILKVLPDNIILVDRGLEDGILRNDHAKFGNETVGFAGRAICLRAQGTTSYWRLYRVPYGEAFSMDMQYSITGMADREIPMPEAKIRDRRQAIPGLEQKRKVGADPFAVAVDLPERLSERDLLESTGLEQQKLFIERAIDQDRLKRDLSQYRVSVYASPFTRQTINEGESYRYGFRGSNMASRYRLLTQFEQQQTRLMDPFTREKVSTRNTSGQAQFVIHRLNQNFSSLSLINYNSQRFSAIATPSGHWQFGPLGFTWHLHESKTWEYLDLSYIPLYDLRRTQYFTGVASGTAITETRGVRHGFRLGMKRKVNERVAFENFLWVRPFQDAASWNIDTGDLNLVNDLRLIFSLTENLFFDYNLIYQRDRLWKTISNLPENNYINSINVRYDFNL
jgi:hypothetical protein